MQKLNEAQRKDFTSSQQEELQRLKTVYIQQNSELKSKLNEQSYVNEELQAKVHNLDKDKNELERQIKIFKEETKSKDKVHHEVLKNMEKERE